MSDPRPADEDELISRVLDGDATAVDRARVAGDARLQARLRDFERVRAAIADVEAPSAAARDAAITAALAEAAPGVAADDGVSTDMLDYARGRRRRHVATVVAVAAALLIGLPLLAIALTGRGTEQKSASTAGVESAADAPTDTGAPLVEGAGATSGYAGDLGPLDNDAQLQAAVALAITVGIGVERRRRRGLATRATDADGRRERLRSIELVDTRPRRRRASTSSRHPTRVWAPPFSPPPRRGRANRRWWSSTEGATDTIVVVRDGCTVVARLPA